MHFLYIFFYFQNVVLERVLTEFALRSQHQQNNVTNRRYLPKAAHYRNFFVTFAFEAHIGKKNTNCFFHTNPFNLFLSQKTFLYDIIMLNCDALKAEAKTHNGEKRELTL